MMMRWPVSLGPPAPWPRRSLRTLRRLAGGAPVPQPVPGTPLPTPFPTPETPPEVNDPTVPHEHEPVRDPLPVERNALHGCGV